MWLCWRCGEMITENVETCAHCGASRDATNSQEVQKGANDPSQPEAKSEQPESDEATSDELTPIWPRERPVTQEGLATLLLRFLGLCFTAFGVVAVATVAGHLLLLSTKYGLDDAVRRYRPLESLIGPAAELIIGVYFLVGGQWVYDKILTPVSRSFADDSAPETEDDDSWRTWKSADGLYTVKAKFVQATDESVDLLKADGSAITVERSRLSEDDRNWITKQKTIE